MILRPEQIRLMALGLPATPCNGGGSSDSSNATTTNNQDQRNSVASGAVGATASTGGTVTLNVSQLDGGAIAQSFGLASTALNDVVTMGTASMSASQHSAEDAINGILAGAQNAQQAYSDATKQVTAAYQDSKTGDQKILVVGAMIVAALAVAAPMLKKA